MPTIEQQLELHEGRKAFPYDDKTGQLIKPGMTLVGKITIGIGRNLSDVGLRPAEIDYLLKNDIDKASADCLLAFPFFKRLDPIRQQVIVDMVFNMGVGKVKRFRDMVAALTIGDYDTAAVEMLDSAWSEQVGTRSFRLAEMMRTGKPYVA